MWSGRATLAVVAVAVALTFLFAGPSQVASPLMERDGEVTGKQAFILGTPTGQSIIAEEAAWEGHPVVVFTVQSNMLATYTQPTPSIVHPLDPTYRVFAVSAKSTEMGCLAMWPPAVDLGIGAADQLIDVCHRGTWDVLNSGAPVAGTMTNGGRLASLDIQTDGLGLAATSFNGPVGPRPLATV